MKTIMKSLTAIFLAFTLLSLPAFADTKSKNMDSSLFVLIAKQGQIQQISKQDLTYKLTLTDVNPEVVYFLDRPARKSGQVPLAKFLKEWDKGSFAQVPPNAVMEAIRLTVDNQNESKHSVSYAIVLSNPQYKEKTHQLTFTIKSLPGNATPIPANAKSDYVALFIDDGCGPCLGL